MDVYVINLSSCCEFRLLKNTTKIISLTHLRQIALTDKRLLGYQMKVFPSFQFELEFDL